MLALALVLASTTTIGPDLVERLSLPVPSAPGAQQPMHVALLGDEVITAQGRALERRTLDGTVRDRVALPCDVVDLAGDRDVIGVLCADRVLSARLRAQTEGGTRFIETALRDEGAPPMLLALRSAFDVWAVAFADGLVLRGRFGSAAHVSAEASAAQFSAEASAAPATEAVDLHARPTALRVSGIDDVDIALADGTAHRWRSGRVEPQSSFGAPALVEVFVDAQGARHARISHGVVIAAREMFTDGSAIALSVDARAFPEEITAVALGVDRVCVTTSRALTCFADVAIESEVPTAGALARDGTVSDTAIPGVRSDVVDAPADPTSPGAIAAYASLGLGVGLLASAPFVLSALSPSVPFEAASAIAGLGGVAGVASFALVASAAIIVVAAVYAAMEAGSSSSVTGTGFLDQIARDIGNAIDGCVCALVTIMATVAVVVGAAAVGVVWLSVSAMPSVDVALGGRAPASDPFWPTVGGAAAGAVVGYGLGAGLSLLTMPLREDEDEDGEGQDELAMGLDVVQGVVHVVALGAVGASIGYGLARGP